MNSGPSRLQCACARRSRNALQQRGKGGVNSGPSRLQCACARRARNVCAAGSGRPRSRFAGRTDRTTGAGRALTEVRAPLGGPRRLLGCPCCPGPAPRSVIPASGADSGVSWRPARARVTGCPAECGERAGPPWPWPGKCSIGWAAGPLVLGPEVHARLLFASAGRGLVHGSEVSPSSAWSPDLAS